ncbi:ribosome biogenesis regulatory protein [Pelomyxa schiedti]|nr:ribosome biogenesis regulatory protein [Pelomyxa schiedti]
MAVSRRHHSHNGAVANGVRDMKARAGLWAPHRECDAMASARSCSHALWDDTIRSLPVAGSFSNGDLQLHILYYPGHSSMEGTTASATETQPQAIPQSAVPSVSAQPSPSETAPEAVKEEEGDYGSGDVKEEEEDIDIKEENEGEDPDEKFLRPSLNNLELDVGNLAVFDPDPVDMRPFKKYRIDYLRVTTQQAVQHLVANLFALPVAEEVPDGVVVKLPKPTTVLPREKPEPLAKIPTRWELFARKKGIQQKKKAGRVWNPETHSWRPSWGRDSAKKVTNQLDGWAVDDKPGVEDPFADATKKKKVAQKQQIINQVRNIRSAARARNEDMGHSPLQLAPKDLDRKGGDSMPKRTNVRFGSSMANSREDRFSAARSKVNDELAIVRRSTASMGRFDPQLEGEKPLAPPRAQTRKQGLHESGMNRESQLALVDKMFAKQKDKLSLTKVVNQELQSAEFRAKTEASKKAIKPNPFSKTSKKKAHGPFARRKTPPSTGGH